MTNEEAIKNIATICQSVEELDDKLLKHLKDIRLATINLRIIDAHLGDNSGITPITDYLMKVMSQMDKDISDLKTHRQVLNDSINKLSNN